MRNRCRRGSLAGAVVGVVGASSVSAVAVDSLELATLASSFSTSVIIVISMQAQYCTMVSNSNVIISRLDISESDISTQ